MLVMPADAGPVQVEETRRAFYAGIAILFEILTTDQDEGDDITDREMKRMEDLAAELNEFVHQLDIDLLPKA